MFKQRKNKTFNYQTRFSKANKVDSNLDISSRKDFVSKWKRDSKSKVGSAKSMRALIIVLVLLLICMYLLENRYM